MLYQVLQEIEAAQGSINLNDLARKLNIDRNALDGMIQFWVRKGRLKDDAQESAAVPNACGGGGCSESCAPSTGCPFVMTMPRTYTLKRNDLD